MLIFKGKVKGHTIDILIDSGASGNFIRKDLMEKAGIRT
jgi:predicted aspartyl protease